MSEDRLAALKASAARTRLRVEVSDVRTPANPQARAVALRAFTATQPRLDHRLAPGFKDAGRGNWRG